MIIKEDVLNNEMDLWKKFFNNYESLATNVLADVLAHYKKEDRDALIKKVEETLESVKEPIEASLMYECIKGDVESFDRINEESRVAYRTLKWIKEIGEEPAEEEVKEKKSK